ncbi:MAG: sigma-54-dependent Fis family transcriptional regulator, partial [Calditrichaeota bacterium]|nr:sigma-54-dependent Fis family transcriptional regulator [Calditrichota bacterium]
TNRNLETAIRNREFRSDLFYRLNAFTIFLPSLRERLEDIPPLAYHFLQVANQKVKKQVNKITPPALSAIMEYEWPGNIRELKNVIERAVVMTTAHQIEMIHLPVKLRQESAALEIQDSDLSEGLMALKSRMVNRFEYEAICRYLTASQGNVSRAAAAAQVPRRTFQRLMAKHRISTETFKINGP